MDWPWTLWEITVNSLETGLFVLLLLNQLEYPKERKKIIFISYVVLVIIETLLNFTNATQLTTVLVLLSADIVFALSLFKGNLPKRLLWGCSGMIIAQCCNILTVNLFTLFGHADIQESLSPTATRFAMMVCYILLYALFYFILSHIRPKKKMFLNWQMRMILIIIFIIGLVSIQRIIDVFIFYNQAGVGVDVSYVNESLIFISAVIVGTFLSMLFMFEYIGSLAQKNLDAQEELQQSKWQNEHYKNVKDTYQALRSWKHDFQNHLDVLGAYLQNQKYSEMQKYLAQISTEIEPFMHLYTTGNDVADAVLSNKLFIAHSKGIRVNASVVLPEKMTISDVQLCSVLSNLLDNAIEAQQSAAEPFININIRPERGMLTMKIENSSAGNYNLKKRQLYTTKKAKGHGIGLQQVRKIVENARGILDVQPQADMFAVKILLPLDRDQDV